MSLLKKIFFLSLFILFISLLFWGVYILAFKKNSSTTIKNNPIDNQNNTLDAATEKIVPISEEAIIAPTLSADGTALEYFSESTGQITQIDFYGNLRKKLSSQNIEHLASASWSVDKLKTIIQTTNGVTPVFSLYNLPTGQFTPLKSNLEQVTWQTNTNRILYKYYDAATKTRTLNVSDPDGSNWAKLADIGYKNLSIAQTPRTGLISFWNSGDAYAKTSFQSVPVTGGNIKTINTMDFGADYLWSNSGNWVLVSHTDAQGGSKMNLGLMNANGGEYRNLDIPTFITKCVWSKDDKTIYYALPGNIPNDSILPNDYTNNKFQTIDTFWKVDVASGKKTRLIETQDIGGQYDASQLFLNQSESLLFFVNKLDGRLYKITL